MQRIFECEISNNVFHDHVSCIVGRTGATVVADQIV